MRLQKSDAEQRLWNVNAVISVRVSPYANLERPDVMELARAADRILKATIINVLVPRLTLSAVEDLLYPAQVW